MPHGNPMLLDHATLNKNKMKFSYNLGSVKVACTKASELRYDLLQVNSVLIKVTFMLHIL